MIEPTERRAAGEPAALVRYAGAALLAMCVFVVINTLVVLARPDAGRSMPNGMLLAVGVFAIVFTVRFVQDRLSEGRQRTVRRQPRPSAAETVVFESDLVRPVGRADRPKAPRADRTTGVVEPSPPRD